MRITNRQLYVLLCDMACELEELRNKIDAMSPEEEPKRGRGRPKSSKK